MHDRLRRVIPLVILLALIAAGVWLWRGRSAAQNDDRMVSGTIEATEVTVGAESMGRVVAVNAGEGDAVVAGQELVVFDAALLQAQRKQAEAALAAAKGAQAAAEANAEAAQAQLDQVRAGARSQEIRAQEEAAAAAQSRIDTAQAQLDQSRGALQAAEAQRKQAVARLAQVKDGPRVEVIEQALSQYQQAEAAVRQAQAEYDKIKERADVGAMPQSLALERATLAQQAAKANYDALVRGATTPELDQARAGVDQALAGIIQASAAVSQTEAALVSARAGSRAEEARLELIRAGARPEQVKAAEAQAAAARAQVEAAEGQVAAAQAALGVIDEQLARMTIRAPSDGVVLSRAIEPGEVAMPGGALLTLGDLGRLTLTVYLAEDRYGAVRVGQPVQVRVDSFPGRAFDGVVQRIADRGEFTPRNVQTPAGRRAVVFAVKIGLDNPDGALKPGMPADVAFE
jgi:multidrug resistance efflux pump